MMCLRCEGMKTKTAYTGIAEPILGFEIGIVIAINTLTQFS